MIEKIKEILKKLDVKEYKLNISSTESSELFFIKKSLDMSRGKDVTHYSLTIYNVFEEEGKRFRGASTISIYPSMETEEIEKLIKDAYFAAGFVKNDYYTIPVSGDENGPINEKKETHSLVELAAMVKEAVYNVDTLKTSFINSCEIFIDKTNVRIINSNGVDVSYEEYLYTIECITQSVNEEDVELYNMLKYNSFNREAMQEEIKASIENVGFRSIAKPDLKTGSYRVLLTKEAVKTMMEYYTNKASANMVYNGISNFKIGQCVQGSTIKGDKVNIKVSSDAPYDKDGVRLKETSLIEDGVLKTYCGDVRYAYYLGIKPTGNLSKAIIQCGDKSEEAMKQGDYLELLNFSDFQMDPLTGDFGGEIRLGFLVKDGVKTPVTGGSFTGNIKDIQENMHLSKDKYISEDYEGPKIMEIFNARISGN